MSLVIVKCINSLIMSLAIIFTTMYLTDEKIKLLSINTVFWIFISISPCFVFYDPGYNMIFTIFSFLCLVLLVNNLFNINVMSSSIIVMYFIILSILPDLVVSSIVINFLDYNQLINNLFVFFITNFSVSIITCFLFRIPFITKLTNNSIIKISKSKYKNIVLYAVLSFTSIGIAYYSITGIFHPTHTYFIINLLALFLIVLVFVYVGELIKYNQLEDKNAILYECMKNIENYQEEQDLKIHEYKNQLSKITALTSDRIVLEKLEEILNVDLTTDVYLLGKLKNVPKGELKSLIYYKMLIANKENLKLSISVTKLDKDSYKFTREQEKSLSNLIGIFFDNAIEAAKESSEKKLLFEIYNSNLGVTFLIENSFSGNIDINKMDKKGFTTKGKGRGNGLHFAKKIINKNIGIYTRKLIENNCFVQKIIIKKE